MTTISNAVDSAVLIQPIENEHVTMEEFTRVVERRLEQNLREIPWDDVRAEKPARQAQVLSVLMERKPGSWQELAAFMVQQATDLPKLNTALLKISTNWKPRYFTAFTVTLAAQLRANALLEPNTPGLLQLIGAGKADQQFLKSIVKNPPADMEQLMDRGGDETGISLVNDVYSACREYGIGDPNDIQNCITDIANDALEYMATATLEQQLTPYGVSIYRNYIAPISKETQLARIQLRVRNLETRAGFFGGAQELKAIYDTAVREHMVFRRNEHDQLVPPNPVIAVPAIAKSVHDTLTKRLIVRMQIQYGTTEKIKL